MYIRYFVLGVGIFVFFVIISCNTDENSRRNKSIKNQKIIEEIANSKTPIRKMTLEDKLKIPDFKLWTDTSVSLNSFTDFKRIYFIPDGSSEIIFEFQGDTFDSNMIQIDYIKKTNIFSDNIRYHIKGDAGKDLELLGFIDYSEQQSNNTVAIALIKAKSVFNYKYLSYYLSNSRFEEILSNSKQSKFTTVKFDSRKKALSWYHKNKPFRFFQGKHLLYEVLVTNPSKIIREKLKKRGCSNGDFYRSWADIPSTYRNVAKCYIKDERFLKRLGLDYQILQDKVPITLRYLK